MNKQRATERERERENRKNDQREFLSERTERTFWQWITIIALLLTLISGSILIANWWTRHQQIAKLQAQLAQKEQEAQQQYQLQEKYLISTATLAKSPQIQAFFTDLLRTYAERFARSKKIDISYLPLEFAGLYYDPKTGNGYGEMGRCFTETLIYPYHQKVINISLNRLYLLNKFGHDRYFTDYPQGDYAYLDISFNKMIDTSCHELAHYIQLVKYGKSSCESDRILNNGEYNQRLAHEHKEFTQEIYLMIKNSGEYLEWERRWGGFN